VQSSPGAAEMSVDVDAVSEYSADQQASFARGDQINQDPEIASADLSLMSSNAPQTHRADVVISTLDAAARGKTLSDASFLQNLFCCPITQVFSIWILCFDVLHQLGHHQCLLA